MRRLVPLAVVLAAAAMSTAAHAATVKVSVDPGRPGPRIAPRFVGLSFEASALPYVARGSQRGNLVPLLRSLGPGVMRFGGGSVDLTTAFSVDGESPPWATSTIRPRDFDRLARLARRTGWRVLLAVSLGRYDPAAGAWETAVANRRLREALMAVEIGNEPNAFWFNGLRPPGWRYADYRQEIRAYRSAIAAAAPGVRIAGPDTALLDDYSWLETFAREERPSLLTPHHYPLHRCYRAPPTIADLLHPPLAEEEARVLRTFAQIGRRHGLPVRVGETNSVGCWGQPGVSNTFAASLWALRYMLASTRAGIAGVNFHTHPGLCDGYSPICAGTRPRYAAGRLRRMPVWYALLLYRQLVGKRLIGVSHAPGLPGVTIEAFRGTRGAALDVVAVNTRPRPVRLALRVRGHRDARAGTVWRLTAPALDSRHRVRLVREPVTTRGPLAVPGSSAALVRLESPSSLPAR